MKLKTRQVSKGRYSFFVHGRHVRRPGMPQFESSLAAEVAADRAHERSVCFRRIKAINRLLRKSMSPEVMKQLCG